VPNDDVVRKFLVLTAVATVTITFVDGFRAMFGFVENPTIQTDISLSNLLGFRETSPPLVYALV